MESEQALRVQKVVSSFIREYKEEFPGLRNVMIHAYTGPMDEDHEFHGWRYDGNGITGDEFDVEGYK